MISNIKIVVLGCFLLISQLSINAQEFNGGLYAGAATSQIDGDHYAGYHKLGFTGGAYVNRFINKKMALQLGLRYIEKGSRKENLYKCKLHYVEMPLTLRYFHYEKIDIEGGIAVGYLIKQYEEFEGFEIIDAPAFNKLELSSILGLNYGISDKISVGAHFSYSLFFIRPYSQLYNNMKKGQHNNVITFSLSYKLSTWR